jgi:hypothetical protein
MNEIYEANIYMFDVDSFELYQVITIIIKIGRSSKRKIFNSSLIR